MSKYKAVVYIGRFEPYHNAHHEIRCRAKVQAEFVITIIGSAFQPRSYKNPFLDTERRLMIQEANMDFHPIEFVRDTVYNNTLWVSRVQSAVSKHTKPGDKIALIGHRKDESSFYMDMFPHWDLIDVDLIEPLHATDIRDLYFNRKVNMNFLRGVVPPSVYSTLKDFKNTEHYEHILAEKEYILECKKPYENLPYGVTFVTADAVVNRSGHILMVKRNGGLGKGLWALPGGFLNPTGDASLKDCMLRELKEETNIPWTDRELEYSITDSYIFDNKNRSLRGRTITTAFNIDLGDGPLLEVVGADDASEAAWIPVSELDPYTCFEDHIDIISHFLGIQF